MGFAGSAPAPPRRRRPSNAKGWFGKRKPHEPPPLAEENVLRNEFFEVRFDPHTGAIRTISDYHSRDPRLAQQIALRLPHGGEPGADVNYSIMAADEIAVTSSGPVLGEIVSRGRLMDREGRRVAGFRQTTRAWRGSRIIEIQIELDIERQPEPNPWDSYYAARFAWKDETAVVHRGANMANLPTELTQFESPHFRRHLPRTSSTRLCCSAGCLTIAGSGRESSTRCWWFAARRPDRFGWASASTCRIRCRRRWDSWRRRWCCPISLGRRIAQRLAVPSRLPQRVGHALGIVATRCK